MLVMLTASRASRASWVTSCEGPVTTTTSSSWTWSSTGVCSADSTATTRTPSYDATSTASVGMPIKGDPERTRSR